MQGYLSNLKNSQSALRQHTGLALAAACALDFVGLNMKSYALGVRRVNEIKGENYHFMETILNASFTRGVLHSGYFLNSETDLRRNLNPHIYILLHLKSQSENFFLTGNF